MSNTLTDEQKEQILTPDVFARILREENNYQRAIDKQEKAEADRKAEDKAHEKELADEHQKAQEQSVGFLSGVFKLAAAKSPGEAMRAGLQMVWGAVTTMSAISKDIGNMLEEWDSSQPQTAQAGVDEYAPVLTQQQPIPLQITAITRGINNG